MNIYSVVGLGYVGLGLATALGRKNKVIAYDINQQRIDELQQGIDRNQLVKSSELQNKNIRYTSRLEDIKEANFYLVCVATPAIFYEFPDLEPLENAAKQLAQVLKRGDVVVFESTVYPGTTEEICIPLLEELSHLTHGKDFHVGYSPERINPSDEEHSLKVIPKIISAQSEKALHLIQAAYGTICDVVYPVSSIKTAESIKLLENTQRDVNIALMNEFTKIMHALDVNMEEVIAGAKTKWNFIPFKPGFVGGHCISIDPHYLAFEAKRCGVYPDLIPTARKVNDGMTHFVIQSLLTLLINNKINRSDARVGLLGVSYKENVPDLRNSLSLKLLKELKQYQFRCFVHDPFVADGKHPSVNIGHFDDFRELSVVIVVVGHDYYRKLGLKKLLSVCKENVIVMDIAHLFTDDAKNFEHLIYWSL